MVEYEIQIKSGVTINCKNLEKHHVCEKDYIRNLTICSCENCQHLASIIDDLMITCDKIIETTKIDPTNFNEKSNL